MQQNPIQYLKARHPSGQHISISITSNHPNASKDPRGDFTNQLVADLQHAQNPCTNANTPRSTHLYTKIFQNLIPLPLTENKVPAQSTTLPI